VPDYIVKSPLKYNGDKYEIDDPVTMPAKQAKPLLDDGVLEESRGKPARSKQSA